MHSVTAITLLAFSAQAPVPPQSYSSPMVGSFSRVPPSTNLILPSPLRILSPYQLPTTLSVPPLFSPPRALPRDVRKSYEREMKIKDKAQRKARKALQNEGDVPFHVKTKSPKVFFGGIHPGTREGQAFKKEQKAKKDSVFLTRTERERVNAGAKKNAKLKEKKAKKAQMGAENWSARGYDVVLPPEVEKLANPSYSGEYFAESSSGVITISLETLISFLGGSAFTFCMLRFCRSALTPGEEPLLIA